MWLRHHPQDSREGQSDTELGRRGFPTYQVAAPERRAVPGIEIRPRAAEGKVIRQRSRAHADLFAFIDERFGELGGHSVNTSLCAGSGIPALFARTSSTPTAWPSPPCRRSTDLLRHPAELAIDVFKGCQRLGVPAKFPMPQPSSVGPANDRHPAGRSTVRGCRRIPLGVSLTPSLWDSRVVEVPGLHAQVAQAIAILCLAF